MRLIDFRSGRTLADDRLERITVAPLTSPLARGAPVQAAVFRLAPGARIARHPADVPQILAVIEGTVEADGEAIDSGTAVFWEKGEEHETTSAAGATVIIIEGEGIEPFSSAAAKT